MITTSQVPVDSNSKIYLICLSLLFLAAIHYFQPNLGGYGLHLSLNSMSWIAVSFLIGAGAFQWLKNTTIYLSATHIVLFCVAICLFIPFLWSESPWRETAIGRYFAIIAFLMLLISHQQFSFEQSGQQKFWSIIICGILIQCVIGFFQFFMSESLPYISGGRPEGTFQQINVYASFIATGIGISAYQLLQQNLNRYLKWLHCLMLLLGSALEVIIQSRTGLLGASLVLVSLCLLFRKKKLVVGFILLITLLGIFLGGFLKYALVPEYRNTEAVSSIGYRGLMYKVSLELIADSPFQGHGIGRFHPVFLNAQAKFLVEHPNIPPPVTNASGHPHNEILFWWVEGGILPVLALVFFVVWFSIRVWRYGNKENKASWLCCIPIILHTQTEYPLYQSVPHLVLLSILLARAQADSVRSFSLAFSLIPKFICVVLPLVVILFMASNLHAIWLLGKYSKTAQSEYLFKIINPFGQQSFINYRKSKEFFKTKHPEVLVEAERLIKREILLRPNEASYWLLYHIQLLQPTSKVQAEETAKHANYLFPASQVFNH